MTLAPARERTIFIPAHTPEPGALVGGSRSHRALPGIRARNQRAPEWSWAACLQMVLGKFGISKDQCELADAGYGLKACRDCDASLSSIRYDQPLPVAQFAAEYAKYQIACQYYEGPISYRAIQAEIDSGRPVQAGIDWRLGCHALLIVGWEESVDGQYLLVNWPRLSPTDASASGSILYQELLIPNNRTGAWKWSWVGIEAR
jgi:hypothetical protein